MINAYKKMKIVYYRDNDVTILRIGLNVGLSNLRKYHSRHEIIRDLSITLTRPCEEGMDFHQLEFEHVCQSALSVNYR